MNLKGENLLVIEEEQERAEGCEEIAESVCMGHG